jgi:hypothetical protein
LGCRKSGWKIKRMDVKKFESRLRAKIPSDAILSPLRDCPGGPIREDGER